MNVDQVLRSLDSQIESASEQAYQYFSSNDIKHPVFEGCELEITKHMCRQIYEGLVRDLVVQRSAFGVRYGLTAFMILRPSEFPDRLAVSFNFGILFCDK